MIWMIETDCEGVQQVPCSDSHPLVFAKEFCGDPKVSDPCPNPGELSGTSLLSVNPSFAGFLFEQLVNKVGFGVL